MLIRNISSRAIVLRDTPGNQYTVAAFSDTTFADTLWTDNVFRQWLRYRIRDIEISEDSDIIGDQALIPTGVKTTNYSAAAADFIPVDTTGGSVTITLPNAPANATRIGVKHIIQGGTNAVTINCAGSDVFNKTGGVTVATLTLANQAISLQYKAAGAIWYVVGDDLPLTGLDARYAAYGGSRPAKYTLASDGTTVTTYDATGAVTGTPGTDFGAALTAILPAAAAAGFAIDLRNNGNIFPNRSLVQFPKGLTSKLLIRGNGALVQAAVSAGRRLFDFNRTADYDSFQNIEINDLWFDRANFTAASNESVFFGNLASGAWSSRLNFKNITLRRCGTLNVPTGTSINYQNVSIVGYHAASAETQTTITDFLFEDLDFTGGGNVGAAVMGSGSSYTAGLGVNVYIDRINLNRVKHDTGRVPTVFNADANIQIGGVGYGGIVRTRDCYGANSGDVGIEIDSIQDYRDRDSVIVDTWNSKCLSRNFRAPVDVKSQRNEWKTTTYNIALDRVNRPSSDFAIGGDPATAGYIFGEMIVDGESWDTITTIPISSGANLIGDPGSGCQFRKLTARMKIGYSNLNITTGGNTCVPVKARSLLAGAEYDLDLTFTLVGARTGTTNNQWKMTDIMGSDATVRARVSFDVAGLTGMTTASDTFYWIGIALDAASTFRLESLTPRCLATLASTQGTHNGVYLSTNLTLSGTRGYVEKMDMSKATAGAGFDVSYQATSQRDSILIRSVVSQRASGGSGPVTAPQAMTGLVTATGLSIGSVTKGIPAVVQFVQGSGAAITAIDFSTNGGTTYTNLLTQSSGAMPAGADLVIGPLPPDALIKVTFTTTQPTINLVPVNP